MSTEVKRGSFHHGDILTAKTDVICHQVNTLGIMGAGLAKHIRGKYPWLYEEYKQYCAQYPAEQLMGTALILRESPSSEQYIANCFAQTKLAKQGEKVTNYTALEDSLMQVASWMSDNGKKSVAIPFRMGCGLAGGDWDAVKSIIIDVFMDTDIFVELWKL